MPTLMPTAGLSYESNLDEPSAKIHDGRILFFGFGFLLCVPQTFLAMFSQSQKTKSEHP